MMALSVITLTTRLAPPGIAPLSPLCSVLVLSASFLRSLNIVICFLWWQRLMKYWLLSQQSCCSLWFTFTSVILRLPEFKPHWTGPYVWHVAATDPPAPAVSDTQSVMWWALLVSQYIFLYLSLLHTPGYNVSNDCNLCARIMRRM